MALLIPASPFAATHLSVHRFHRRHHLPWTFALLLSLIAPAILPAADPTAPMLNLPGTDGDPAKIKFARLPAIKGTHGVICPPDEKWTFQLLNYLRLHGGKFWCMWRPGPKIEDWPTQHVRYATSDDGLKWSLPKMLTREPAVGLGFSAPDFCVADGEMFGLSSTSNGTGGI